MDQVLKAGVAGAGVFGGYHAQQYAAMEGAALAAVFDPDAQRAAALAERLGVQVAASFEALLALSDIVSVASPAITHAELALASLRAGKPTYVEKPIATSLEDADKLLSAAAQSGAVLAVGHVERVVFQAMGLLDIPEPPTFMQAVRNGPWSARNADVSCVLDLMIHDIDLGLALNAAEPLAVEAEARTTHGPHLDEVRAEVTLGDGAAMILEASRIAEARERRMRLVYTSGEVEIDFLSGAFRNTTPFALNADFVETPAGRDRLAVSLGAFVAAAKGEAARPAVTGEEAVRALDLALAIEQACGG